MKRSTGSITVQQAAFENRLNTLIGFNRKELDKLSKIFPGFIHVNDLKEMRNVYSNKNLLEFTGYDEQRIQQLGSSFFREIIHPEDLHLIGEKRNLVKGGNSSGTFSLLFRIKHHAGDWRWVYASSRVLQYSKDGSPWYTLEVAHDTSTLINKRNFDKIIEEHEFMKKNLKRFKRLTPREVEVMCLIAKDYKNQQIANRLYISEQTVETHRKNIIKKLRVASVIGLAKFAHSFC